MTLYQAAEQDASAPANVLPFSCSTNLANDVMDRLRGAKLGSKAWEFCAYLHRRTFGDAGYHRKRGRPEIACRFDLAGWAAALGCDKSNLRRIRDELMACHIIAYDPDEEAPGAGLVAWNTTFEAWLTYDRRRAQRDKITTPACSEITTVTASKTLRSPADHPIKITTLARRQPAQEAGPEIPGRKGTEERQRRSARPREAAAAAASPPQAIAAPATTAAPPAPPAAPVPTDLPEEHDAILAILHAIPDWRVLGRQELALLEEYCPQALGDVGVIYQPAFVLHRARAFDTYLARRRAEEEEAGRRATRADVGAFRTFLSHTSSEEYDRWRQQRSQAQHQERVVARATRPRPPRGQPDPDEQLSRMFAEQRRQREEEAQQQRAAAAATGAALTAKYGAPLAAYGRRTRIEERTTARLAGHTERSDAV